MSVPKKRTSILKKIIRKTIWKKKVYKVSLNVFSLSKSLSTQNSKNFLYLK